MPGYVDYKEMYLKLFRATEKAINILIEAQRECEEMFINAEEPTIRIVDISERFDKE